MKKFLICFVAFSTLISCSKEKTITMEFISGKAYALIESPEHTMTTMCKISINDKSENDLILKVQGSKPICLSKGRINFWRNYEWYDENKEVTLEKIGLEEDQNSVNLRLKFSKQYFGKNVGEGFNKCE